MYLQAKLPVVRQTLLKILISQVICHYNSLLKHEFVYAIGTIVSLTQLLNKYIDLGKPTGKSGAAGSGCSKPN